jgi:hypothetical protein
MDTKKQLKLFTGELLNTRRILQDGRPLTDSEQQALRSSIESLLLDLEANRGKNSSQELRQA